MINSSQQGKRKMKCDTYANRYVIIWCDFSTFSSPVANLEATYGGWPHIVHKMGKAWRMAQQEMSKLDFVCMRNYYCVRQLRRGNCLLQQQELVVLTNWGIFYCARVGQIGKVLHYLKRQRKKQLLTPGKYHEHFFTEKSTSDKDLTDHEIEKKQDYCINRSEHSGKCKHCPNQKNHQTASCCDWMLL